MSNFAEIVMVKADDDRILIRQAPFCTYLSAGDEVIVVDDKPPYSVKGMVLERITIERGSDMYVFLLNLTNFVVEPNDERTDFLPALKRISYQDLYKDPTAEESEVKANG